MSNSHQQWMRLALALAEQGRGTVSPNPMVGCILVQEDRIVGQGYHQYAGGPHAEIVALNEAGLKAKGATAYVTLEPCCHHGRTPPCTDALIAAGIKQVYVACQDPNPLVAGYGIKQLVAAGIAVEVGLCAAEAMQLNEIFFHYIIYRRPFVIAKWAMSLDGKTKVSPEDDKKISSPTSHTHAHQIRHSVDAILIGANTLREDDPELTVRHVSSASSKQPIRIILTHKKELPINAKIFSATMPGKTIVAATHHRYDFLANNNVEILVLPSNSAGEVSLTALLNELGKRHITSLLVEGGTMTHEKFFADNLINKIYVYLSPTIIAALKNKKLVQQITCEKLDRDYCFIADMS